MQNGELSYRQLQINMDAVLGLLFVISVSLHDVLHTILIMQTENELGEFGQPY